MWKNKHYKILNWNRKKYTNLGITFDKIFPYENRIRTTIVQARRAYDA